MFSKRLRRATRTRAVEFCETCGQVCDAACRAEARLERTRLAVIYQVPFLH